MADMGDSAVPQAASAPNTVIRVRTWEAKEMEIRNGDSQIFRYSQSLHEETSNMGRNIFVCSCRRLRRP